MVNLAPPNILSYNLFTVVNLALFSGSSHKKIQLKGHNSFQLNHSDELFDQLNMNINMLYFFFWIQEIFLHDIQYNTHCPNITILAVRLVVYNFWSCKYRLYPL